jgi:hypothetical protein
MTLRGFLMWYLGAVLLVGTAGATGYQILSRHRAQLAARDTAEPAPTAGPPPAMAAAQPAEPGAQVSPLSAANGPSSAATLEPIRRTVASRVHAFPALRPHIGVSYHTALLDRRVARRSTAVALATRPTHHLAAPATETRTTVPRLRAHQYVVPSRPDIGYAPSPLPSVTYYAYPGYQAYQPGYPYYPSPYPYYRVY